MTNYILSEGVLNDDTLHIPSEGEVFSGGYIALIERYKFKTAWSNSKEVIRFRSQERLDKYLNKNYPYFNVM